MAQIGEVIMLTGEVYPSTQPEKVFGLFGVGALWLLAGLPYAGAGLAGIFLALVLPLLYPQLSPLLLFTSFLFYSTIGISADLLYGLRAYWIVVGITYFVLYKRQRFSNNLWFMWITAAVVVAYGLFIGFLRSPIYLSAYRSVLLESLLAALWICGAIVGYAWWKYHNATLSKPTLNTILVVWLISVAYGVAQTLLGLTEYTVPPDVLPQIVGIQQYEELGRRPFAFLTSNGVCVATLMVMPVLLDKKDSGSLWIGSIFFIGLIVAILTLTRSYMLLLLILFLGYGFIYSRKALLTVIFWVGGALVFGLVFLFIEPEIATSAVRLSGESVGGTRLEIWSYILQHKSAADWIFGHGFGSNGWFEFFAGWRSHKILLSPHSALLEITGQFGIFGLFAYIILVIFLIRVFLVLRVSRVGPGAVVAIGLIMLREQVSASYIVSPSVLSGMFWLLMGVLIAQYSIERKTELGGSD